ncbi:MAG: APC family permease [Chthoniobacterales bacterium]
MTTPQLPRALKLRDLVLFNVVAILGIRWVATAAKAGPASLTLWMLAALLFFVPQGLAVVQFSRSYPEEGGIYAWTKREFGEGHGFLCGWCYWINNMLFYPTLLLTAAVQFTYAIGQSDTGLGDNWTFVLPFTLIGLGIATVLNLVGVGTGKWLQNIGGIATYLPGLLLLFAGAFAFFKAPANPITASQLVPDFGNIPLLNLWATIAFAFAGLELVATMGQEIRDPERNLPRSIYISAPLIALIYICGTIAVLWLTPRDQINVTAGPLQAISAGFGNFGRSWTWVGPFAALCLTVSQLGGLGAWLTGSARVAFVVGVDRYFPAAFGRIHPRWKTPYVAILVQVPVTVLFLLLSVLGKGTTVEHAFLILLDMCLLIYFVPYVYLFAAYIAFCRRNPTVKLLVPGGITGAVIAGIAGIAITIFAMIVALIPPAGTTQIWLHELKLAGGSLFLIALGVVSYRRARPSTVAN